MLCMIVSLLTPCRRVVCDLILLYPLCSCSVWVVQLVVIPTSRGWSSVIIEAQMGMMYR